MTRAPVAAVLVADDAVWVITEQTFPRIDPAIDQVVATIDQPAGGVGFLRGRSQPSRRHDQWTVIGHASDGTLWTRLNPSRG